MSPEVGRAVKGPAVSVVLAVRDGLPFIGTAVESILDQTFRDFELVVVDDGSTDGTPQLLAEFARRDSRVRVETQRNRGLVAALNLGCAKARGALVARMDADDVAVPDRLERQVAYLAEHPEVVLLGGGIVRIDAQGRIVDVVSPRLTGRDLRVAMTEGNQLTHPTVVFRRAAFHAAGGYRSAFRHCEDYDMWLRLMEQGDVELLPEAVLFYRLHPGQVSVAHVDQQCVSLLGAQVSVRWRREMGLDPLADVELVSEAHLVELGVPNSRIAALKRRGRIDWAVLLMLAGHPEDALRLYREAVKATPAGRQTTADEEARFFWACAKAYGLRSQYGKSLGALLRVLFLRPFVVVKGARNWIESWSAGRRATRQTVRERRVISGETP